MTQSSAKKIFSFETEHFHIRPLTLEDIDAAEIFLKSNMADLSEYLNWPKTEDYSYIWERDFIRDEMIPNYFNHENKEDDPFHAIFHKDTAEIIGLFHPYKDALDRQRLSYMIASPYRQQGIMKEVYGPAQKRFASLHNLTAMFASTTQDNYASQAILKNHGFTFIGLAPENGHSRYGEEKLCQFAKFDLE